MEGNFSDIALKRKSSYLFGSSQSTESPFEDLWKIFSDFKAGGSTPGIAAPLCPTLMQNAFMDGCPHPEMIISRWWEKMPRHDYSQHPSKNLVVSLQHKPSNNLTLSAPLKAGKDSQRFKLPARHGLKLCQTQGVVTSQIKRFPGCQRALQNNGSSIQGMLEIREISCQLQAGRSNDLKTSKIIIFGIRLLEAVITFFFNIMCNLWSNWIWPRSLPSATPKARCLPTSSPSFVNKTPQNNIANFVFFLPLLLCPTFLSLVVTCLFLQTLGGHPPLHHSCCSGSWIDPAVPNVSRYKYALNTTDCFTAILGLVGLQGKNLNVWSKKYEIYRIESCFGDLPKSPRMGKGERLCFHATCTSRLYSLFVPGFEEWKDFCVYIIEILSCNATCVYMIYDIKSGRFPQPQFHPRTEPQLL